MQLPSVILNVPNIFMMETHSYVEFYNSNIAWKPFSTEM